MLDRTLKQLKFGDRTVGILEDGVLVMKEGLHIIPLTVLFMRGSMSQNISVVMVGPDSMEKQAACTLPAVWVYVLMVDHATEATLKCADVHQDFRDLDANMIPMNACLAMAGAMDDAVIPLVASTASVKKVLSFPPMVSLA